MPEEAQPPISEDLAVAQSTLRSAWQRATLIVVGSSMLLVLAHGIVLSTVSTDMARRGVFALVALGILSVLLLAVFSVQPLILPTGDGAATAPRLQRRVKELDQQVRELQRSNLDLEAFASTASHDLKEPLRLIASYLELLDREHADELDEDARSYIEEAIGGAERMEKLIGGILAYARAGSEKRKAERVPLDQALDDALENLALRIEETDAVIRRDPLPEVQGDPIQLTQVFQNLVSNAIKFRHEDRVPVVEIRCEREEGTWRIEIEDNGIGFDPSEHESMFQIFERGASGRDRGGTGVGLAVCKRIVTRHGGDIDATATPGEGATFTLYLPVAPEKALEDRIQARSRELV